LSINTGWWFGTFVIFPYIGNVIIPTDELHHFSEGLKPPTRTSLAWGIFRLQFEFSEHLTGLLGQDSQIFHCPSKINTMVSQISSETPKFQVSIPQASTQPWESVKKCPGEQVKFFKTQTSYSGMLKSCLKFGNHRK
jgi:hypothetical protein